jgi:hypothetical protein
VAEDGGAQEAERAEAEEATCTKITTTPNTIGADAAVAATGRAAVQFASPC